MKLFDWLGAARRENDEVNADALRIADLEDANVSLNAELADARADIESQDGTIDFLRSLRERECETIQKLRGDLARAIQGNAAWAAKFAEITAEMQRAAPLVAYAKSRKDSLARYELRRAAK